MNRGETITPNYESESGNLRDTYGKRGEKVVRVVDETGKQITSTNYEKLGDLNQLTDEQLRAIIKDSEIREQELLKDAEEKERIADQIAEKRRQAKANQEGIMPVAPEIVSPGRERISSTEAKNTFNKAKNNKGVKTAIGTAVVTATLIVTLAVGGVVGKIAEAVNSPGNGRQNTESAQGYEGESTLESLTGYEEYDSLIDGSFQQYNNPGCYDSEGKSTPNSVANPTEALALIGATPETATSQEWGAAFEYVAFSQSETAAYVATAYGMPGFENVSYQDAAEKIENMSAEEKAEFQHQLDELFDQIEFSMDAVDGTHTNFYIIEQRGEKVGVISTSDLEGERVLTMSLEREDGTTVIAQAMIRCFNGDKMIVEITGQDGTKTIREIPTPGTPSIPPETPSNTPPETPQEGIDPKDYENMERIDQQAHQDIAEDVGTGQINVSQTEVSQSDVTSAPSSSSYQGTSTTTTQSTPSQSAETVTPSNPENTYSQSQGGAHSGEYAPVQSNPDAQAQADAGETPISEAPTSGSEYEDVLNDLGIN